MFQLITTNRQCRTCHAAMCNYSSVKDKNAMKGWKKEAAQNSGGQFDKPHVLHFSLKLLIQCNTLLK